MVCGIPRFLTSPPKLERQPATCSFYFIITPSVLFLVPLHFSPTFLGTCPPRNNEQQIGQPVQVNQNERIVILAVTQADERSLRPPADSSGEMKH